MAGESKGLDTGFTQAAREDALADLDLPRTCRRPADASPNRLPAPRTPPEFSESEEETSPRKAARAAPWLIATGAFTLYALIAILRYERRETMSWDLGIFTEAVRGYAHFQAPMVGIRGQEMDLLGDHWHPILMLLGPFFRVFPTPVTLLVAQSVLLALAAVPLTRTAMDLLGRYQGYAIGIAYGLSWGVVQAANFDFHEVAFAVPAIAFSLCAYIRGEYRKTILWALPLLFVKEDLALLVPIIIAMVVARTRFSGRASPAIDRPRLRGRGRGAHDLLPRESRHPALQPERDLRVLERGRLPRSQTPQRRRQAPHLCAPTVRGRHRRQRAHGGDDPSSGRIRGPALPADPAGGPGAGGPFPQRHAVLLGHGLPLQRRADGRGLRRRDPRPGADQGVARAGGCQRRPRGSGRSTRDENPKPGCAPLGDIQLKHGAVAMLAIAAAFTQSFPLQDLWQHTTWFPSARAQAIKRANRKSRRV